MQQNKNLSEKFRSILEKATIKSLSYRLDSRWMILCCMRNCRLHLLRGLCANIWHLLPPNLLTGLCSRLTSSFKQPEWEGHCPPGLASVSKSITMSSRYNSSRSGAYGLCPDPQWQKSQRTLHSPWSRPYLDGWVSYGPQFFANSASYKALSQISFYLSLRLRKVVEEIRYSLA